jgi:hypothetical protein
MFENIGQILVLVVAAGLMIFSASGTLSLLQPGLGDAAYFALLAFDGGVVAWLMTFMHGAKGGPQRAIAALMIVLDLLGCVVGFGVNLIMTFGKIGEVARLDQSTTFTALLAVVFVIAANIAATVFYHLLSVDNRKRMAEEALHDAIDKAANRKAKAAIPDLADRLADMMTESQMQQLESHYRATVTAASAKRPALAEPQPIRRWLRPVVKPVVTLADEHAIGGGTAEDADKAENPKAAKG